MTEKTVNKKYQKPKRIFEKSGSVDPKASYYVVLENVVNPDNQDIKTMIDNGRYFSMFAPRQSGKTTFLEAVRSKLQTDPTYVVILLSFQNLKKVGKKQFYNQIRKKIYIQLKSRLNEVKCRQYAAVEHLFQQIHIIDHLSFMNLFEELNQIIQSKKIVIFIDEFDGIPGSELENFLTTLRELYISYKKIKQKALYSIGLIGIRNITKLIVGGVSPFNIADHVELPPFSLKNIHHLYSQYTEETNQPFTAEAVKKVYEETEGQPWLVNRLGTILTVNVKPGTIEPINRDDVEKAIEILLSERNDHFDNLYEKAKPYKETFVKIVLNNVKYSSNDEDQTWLEQYGLIKKKEKKAVVANSIYRERYIETFFNEVEVTENIFTGGYLTPGDRLDMERVLLDFDQYIAQIGVRAFYKYKKPYERTGQFLLTAWLYRFAKNGLGNLHYETPSGLERMDIILSYKGRKYIIETKVNHQDDITRVLDQGIKQLVYQYLATESAQEGYLVIFDTRTHAGAVCKPQEHREGDKKVISFIIGIGKNPGIRKGVRQVGHE